MPSKGCDDPRIYLSAEQTFLSWIRTGLALMGVGFAVARFALFLKEARTGPSEALPIYAGVAVVLLGVAVLLTAIVQHRKLVRSLQDGTWEPGDATRTAAILAAILAVIGGAIAVYLLVTH